MVKSFLKFAILYFCFLAYFQPTSQAQSTANENGDRTKSLSDPDQKKSEVFPATASIVIQGPRDGSVYPAQLGNIPTDRPVDLKLTIRNSSNDRFNFDQAQVSCSCVRVVIPNSVLEPGKEIVCNALIDTRSKQRSHQFQVPLKLWDSHLEAEEIIIVLTGYLDGYLGFNDPFSVIEISDSKELVEISVPFVATAPIIGDLVHVEQQPRIGDYRFERIEGTKESWNLILSLRTADVLNEGVALALKIEDFATGRTAQRQVMVSRDMAVRLSPRTLRLALNDNGDLVGSAILTIRAPAPDAGPISLTNGDSTAEANEMPVVSATIAGKHVKVSTRKLNDQHFRVNVSVSESRVSQIEDHEHLDQSKITWSVSTKAGAYQFTVPITYLRSRE